MANAAVAPLLSFRLVRVARGNRSHDAFKPVHAKQVSVCGGVVRLLLRSASSTFLSGFLDALWAPKDEPGGAPHLMNVLNQLSGHVATMVRGGPHATAGAPPTALEAACAALVARLSQRLDEIDPLKEVERRKEQLRLQNWRP